MHFLTWLEQTDLSRWVTESPSLFAYPSILFLHTAGLAFLVGPSIAILIVSVRAASHVADTTGDGVRMRGE